MRRLSLALVVALAMGHAPRALADGQRDLEDGIAFYENLDTDRAAERLRAASVAADLAPPQRARAFLYLGMLEFELGSEADARSAWTEAFRLNPTIQPPDGTSPKTIAALADVRAKVATEEVGGPKLAPPPPVAPPPPLELTPPPPAPPSGPDPAAVVAPAPSDDSGGTPWLWIGIGGAVVVAAGVVAIVLLSGGSSSECSTGGGGCVAVTFR